jgi:histone H2B
MPKGCQGSSKGQPAAKKKAQPKRQNENKGAPEGPTRVAARVRPSVLKKTGIYRRARSSTTSSTRSPFINDILDKVAAEFGRLCRYNEHATFSFREIQTAARLVLPIELAKHTVCQTVSVFTEQKALEQCIFEQVTETRCTATLPSEKDAPHPVNDFLPKQSLLKPVLLGPHIKLKLLPVCGAPVVLWR